LIKSTQQREYAQFFLGTIVNPGTGAVETVYKKVETGLTTQNKIGWEITGMELYIVDPWDEVANLQNLNSVRMALAANQLYGMNPLSPSMYVHRGWFRTLGALANTPPVVQINSMMVPNPFVWDFNEPILILPQSLYVGLEVSSDATEEISFCFRVQYRNIELKEAEFYDLLQLYNPLGSL
jgi:hypothetical protein